MWEGVSLLLLPWALGIKLRPSSLVAGTSTYRLPLQHSPVDFCVHISALWTSSTPGQESLASPPSPCAPTSATSSHSSLSWSIGSWVFSAVGPWAGSQQPRPMLGGGRTGQSLVLVVELSKDGKLLLLRPGPRTVSPKAAGTNLQRLYGRLCMFQSPKHTRPSCH